MLGDEGPESEPLRAIGSRIAARLQRFLLRTPRGDCPRRPPERGSGWTRSSSSSADGRSVNRSPSCAATVIEAIATARAHVPAEVGTRPASGRVALSADPARRLHHAAPAGRKSWNEGAAPPADGSRYRRPLAYPCGRCPHEEGLSNGIRGIRRAQALHPGIRRPDGRPDGAEGTNRSSTRGATRNSWRVLSRVHL